MVNYWIWVLLKKANFYVLIILGGLKHLKQISGVGNLGKLLFESGKILKQVSSHVKPLWYKTYAKGFLCSPNERVTKAQRYWRTKSSADRWSNKLFASNEIVARVSPSEHNPQTQHRLRPDHSDGNNTICSILHIMRRTLKKQLTVKHYRP